MPSIFLRDIDTNDLLIENADNEQNDLFKMFVNLNKGRKSSEKIPFLKSVKILLKAREDVINSFKSYLFLIISDTTPYATPDTTRYTTSDTTLRQTRSETSRLNKNLINEIKNDEKNINTEVYNEYFGYRNSSFLEEDLFKANQVKNNQKVNQTTDSINELRNYIF